LCRPAAVPARPAVCTPPALATECVQGRVPSPRGWRGTTSQVRALRCPVLSHQGSWSDGESLGPGPMAAFDGQGSGDDFYGVCSLLPCRLCARILLRGHAATFVSCLVPSPSCIVFPPPGLTSSSHACEQNFWHPSHGWVNSTDGGRGHTFQDYQQQ